MERPAERGRKVAHRDRVRSRRVDRSRDGGVLDGPDVHADEVGLVDPGDPLLSASERPAREGAKGRQHLREGAAARAEDDARPQHGHPDPEGLEGARGRLPVHAELREEVVPRGRVLGEGLVAARAVEADSRRVHEGSGPDRGLFRRGPQAVGGVQPAPLDPRFRGSRPALGDRLAREVHEGAGAVHEAFPGRALGPRGDAHLRVHVVPRARGVARQGDHVVSTRDEPFAQLRPYETGPAGDDDAHPLSLVPRSYRNRTSRDAVSSRG